MVCPATNQTGCCPPGNPPGSWSTVSYAPGCANYLNPSVNSRMLKHRCRLEQRGFRPKQYSTDILAFESKWNQCASWLPPGARHEEPRAQPFTVGSSSPSTTISADTAAKVDTEAKRELLPLLARLEAAGVSVEDVRAVQGLAARAHALEL
jgi:hypothetical protein